MRLLKICVFVFLFAPLAHGQMPGITVLQEGKPTSIRGLSVLNDKVAYVSGSNGWVGKTTNKGKRWKWYQVPGQEKADFRDIVVFSKKEAAIISAGSPLVILKTRDGGKSWKETYRDERQEIFFDGMDFWDEQRGIAYGDPIGGRMQLLATKDGGDSWHDISDSVNIRLRDGEAGFAASGTGIRVLPGGQVFIATGGSQSRVFASSDYGRTWQTFPIPIRQGLPSTGAFSIAFADAWQGIAVGGDYSDDKNATDAIALTRNRGITWDKPAVPTGGYRSAVEYIGRDTWIATGTSGVDISYDNGETWVNVSDESYHVVRRAKNGNWVLLAGAKGRIADLVK